MPESASSEAMRAFWDEKARENALWFIDSSLDYASPDANAFWASGQKTLEETLHLFGVKLSGDERVLEIGCGIGRITRALAHMAGEVVGIDVSAEMIDRGQEALGDLPNVELRVTSGIDLAEFAPGSFDVGYSFVTFQHIPDPAITCNYIAELGRVLRPGGWALFQISQHPDFHRREYWGRVPLASRISELLGRTPKGRMKPQWLGSTVGPDQLTAALERGDLDLEAMRGEGSLFCFVLARARKDSTHD